MSAPNRLTPVPGKPAAEPAPRPPRQRLDADKPLSSVEAIKANSRGLRGRIAEQLADGTSHFDEEGYQLLKFHGMYQQEDRDLRKERKSQGAEPAYMFMVRSRIPGGVLTAEQWLVEDELADRYGNGTLRITTRQGLQLHGVLKGNLKATLQALNAALVTTLGACGDVNRNVIGCPAPEHDRLRAQVSELCRSIADYLAPRTRAYHEIWLDGEPVQLDEGEEEEPLYGATYLPRKFKIAVAFPHDNCVDVFAHDVGLIPVLDKGGQVRGFNVAIGGSMGMTHNNPDTFPALAKPVGFVRADRLFKAIESIVTFQRDYGNRSNRKRARLKYVIAEWGLEAVKEAVEERMGFAFQPWEEVGPFFVDDHLGWREQGDGRLYLGLPVESGRVADRGERRLKSGLRRIVETFRPGVRLTPQQNILLTDLDPAARPEIESLLREYGIQQVESLSPLRRYALACPALPTCGLAISESERVLPQVLASLEAEMAALEIGSEEIHLHMTGCPNGCARPYTAELALVGRSKDKYNLYVGGSREGTRLAWEAAQMVPLDRIGEAVRPLLSRWREERLPGEGFGDFWHRVGREVAEELVTNALGGSNR